MEFRLNGIWQRTYSAKDLEELEVADWYTRGTLIVTDEGDEVVFQISCDWREVVSSTFNPRYNYEFVTEREQDSIEVINLE